MSIQIRDEPTAAVLATAAGWHELRGPGGHLLGQFIPAPRPGMSFPELGVTDEELDSRANDPNGWVTAAAVEARLRELQDAP